MLGVSVRISYCANLVAQVDVLYIQHRLCIAPRQLHFFRATESERLLCPAACMTATRTYIVDPTMCQSNDEIHCFTLGISQLLR